MSFYTVNIYDIIYSSVLWRIKKKRETRRFQGHFQLYLIILSIVDSLVILLFLIDNGFIAHFATTSDKWTFMVIPFVTYPIKNISITMSMVWVVVVAVERYLAVTQPLKPRNKISSYVIFLFVFSITANCSKYRKQITFASICIMFYLSDSLRCTPTHLLTALALTSRF